MFRVFENFVVELKKLSKKDRVWALIYSIFLLGLSLIDASALSLLSNILRGSSSQSLMNHAADLIFVIFLFISKSIFAAIITYASMRHFEHIEFNLGSQNVSKVQVFSWSSMRQFSNTDLLNLFDRSPNATTASLLFPSALFISELLTVAAIGSVLLFENFLSSLAALAFFLLVVVVQNRFLGNLSAKVGKQMLDGDTETKRRSLEIYELGKYLKVSPSDFLYRRLNQSRKKLVRARNSAWYLGSVPRYYMEAVLVMGMLIVAGTSYLAGGADAIFPSLSLFAAAGYRLLPTVNRMQGYALTAIAAIPYIELQNNLLKKEDKLAQDTGDLEVFAEKDVLVRLNNVSLRFPDAPDFVLMDISLTVQKGRKYAVVGETGSGKTTLGDLCLGLLTQSSGSIWRLSGLEVAYVPQETAIIQGSLAENIALDEDFDEIKMAQAINQAELSEFARTADLSQLSGGQKQRIGLARALYRDAEFIVFDEATSALDNSTESRIIKNLSQMSLGGAALLVIAHRLSTVREADEILVLNKGKITAVGTWDVLMKTSAEFREAVRLGDLSQTRIQNG